MTYKEIIVSIRASEKRRRDDLQTRAALAYRQADLIAAFVGCVFGSKQRPPSMDEVFPGLFPERPKQDWRLMKARVQAYADDRRKRGDANGNNTGRTAGADKRRD